MLLMAVKVSAFHTYTHDLDTEKGAIENCVSCDALLENQKTLFDAAQSSVTLAINTVTYDYLIVNYQNTPLIPSSYLGSSLFYRPPPALN